MLTLRTRDNRLHKFSFAILILRCSLALYSTLIVVGLLHSWRRFTATGRPAARRRGQGTQGKASFPRDVWSGGIGFKYGLSSQHCSAGSRTSDIDAGTVFRSGSINTGSGTSPQFLLLWADKVQRQIFQVQSGRTPSKNSEMLASFSMKVSNLRRIGLRVSSIRPKLSRGRKWLRSCCHLHVCFRPWTGWRASLACGRSVSLPLTKLFQKALDGLQTSPQKPSHCPEETSGSAKFPPPSMLNHTDNFSLGFQRDRVAGQSESQLSYGANRVGLRIADKDATPAEVARIEKLASASQRCNEPRNFTGNRRETLRL